MEKSFWKTNEKTIKDQGEKQIEAIKWDGKQLPNTNKHSYGNEPLFSKGKEVFKNIDNKGLISRTIK